MVEATYSSVAARLALIDRLLSNPPNVHFTGVEEWKLGNRSGVWATDRDCYQFLAERCPPGSNTLETGVGISTILFAAWGATHLCITPDADEIDGVKSYCQANAISIDALTFEVACSDAFLPTLGPEGPAADVVLLDGGHGFPVPMIDWYYGGGRLRKGGTLIIDDLHLPAVAVLDQFLTEDDRWTRVGGTKKWAAYERQSEGPVGEDWYTQPFYSGPPVLSRLARAEARIRRPLNPLLQRLRKQPG
jgi:hypothetical protein